MRYAQRHPMQNASATGFWLRLVRENACEPIASALPEVPNGWAWTPILGSENVFEKLVRWVQKHWVANGELQEPTRQPRDEKFDADSSKYTHEGV